MKSNFLRSGRVLKLMENDNIKVRTDPNYPKLNYEQVELILPKSAIFQHCIDNRFVVDITNYNLAHSELILRNNDNIELYHVLNDNLNDIYKGLWYDDIIDDAQHEIEYLSNFVSVMIYKCLYRSKYNYRIECIFDDQELLYESQWKYHTQKTLYALKKGIETSEIQARWNCTGYSCDLCRIEVSYYEFMYHCDDGCDDKRYGWQHKHDFCVSCVYALLSQFKEMKPFLTEMLKSVLNDHCIDEIVAFCVGKIIKFDCK